MTDDRPRPKYGEYAPIGSVPPVAASEPVAAPKDAGIAQSAPDALPTKRRTWDVGLTTALILAGVFDVVGSFSRFGNLAATLREVYAQQGLGTFTNDALANDMGIAINVTRVVLLVAAIGFGLWRLGQNKIAFWIPLTAGVLAFIVVGVCLLVVVVSDPALAEYVAQQSTAP
ncbi:MAG: DUF6264 family protein [Rhodoglobus sp.]